VVESVVARLPGRAPTVAIVLLAHYDSVPAGPGAADNGSGVAALLEVMRALAAGPPPRNDVIVLFDDGEEAGYLGTRAFVQQHPWMADVRVAVSLDTAVRGPAQVTQTGPANGWLVRALARAVPDGAWSSASGAGGMFDYSIFRQAGIQGLALEDIFAFPEQHTAFDRPAIVSAASMQQLGEQALAIARELGRLDLAQPWGEDAVFFSAPLVGLVHYPAAWTRPLLAGAGGLLALAAGLARRRARATWRGLGAATGLRLGVALASALGAFGLWVLLQRLVSWENPNWPEVIPPAGGAVLLASAALTLGLTLAAGRFARRRFAPAETALAGLVACLLLGLVFAVALPVAIYVPLWTVVIGSLGWLVALAVARPGVAWLAALAALPAAATFLSLGLPLLVLAYIGTGLSRVAVLALVWALLLGVVLPALDGLLVPPRRRASGGAEEAA
jgi:hypothetical protein